VLVKWVRPPNQNHNKLDERKTRPPESQRPKRNRYGVPRLAPSRGTFLNNIFVAFLLLSFALFFVPIFLSANIERHLKKNIKILRLCEFVINSEGIGFTSDMENLFMSWDAVKWTHITNRFITLISYNIKIYIPKNKIENEVNDFLCEKIKTLNTYS